MQRVHLGAPTPPIAASCHVSPRAQGRAWQHKTAAPKVARMPGSGTAPRQPQSLAGLPLGTQLVCQQLRFISALPLQLGGQQSRQPLGAGRWGLKLLSFHLHQGCAAAVHGHVVERWERGWGIVPGRAALLGESIPAVMGRVGASDKVYYKSPPVESRGEERTPFLSKLILREEPGCSWIPS